MSDVRDHLNRCSEKVIGHYPLLLASAKWCLCVGHLGHHRGLYLRCSRGGNLVRSDRALVASDLL